jgi:hypothetical protein
MFYTNTCSLSSVTLQLVLKNAQMRMLPIANRTADYAPVIPACCNACRVCATNYVFGLAAAAGAAVLAFSGRLVRRFSAAA